MTALDDLRASGGVQRLAEYLLPKGHPEQGGSVWRAGGSDGDTGRSLTCALTGDQSGTYYDHASGDRGSLVQLVMEQERIATPREARTWMADHGFISRSVNAASSPPPTMKQNADIHPAAPDDEPPPGNSIRTKQGLVSPSGKWRYRLADGRTAFWVLRYDPPDASKQIRSVVWATRTDQNDRPHTGWAMRGYTVPRPIYRLPELTENPDALVVVVEGEKAADAAARLLPDTCIVTSANGSKAATKSDWTPIAERTILLLPDNDEPGDDYIAQVATLVRETNPDAKFRRVDPHKIARLLGASDIPAGWDVADTPPLTNPITPGPLQSASEDYEPPANQKRRAQANASERNAAIELAAKSLTTDRLAYVDGEFWEQRDTHWEPVREDAMYRRVGLALDDAAREIKPGYVRWLSRNDHRETMHDLRVATTPASVDLLDAARQMSPFDLDTGAVAEGTAFANGVLAIKTTGPPELQPHRPRIFRRWSLPYPWNPELPAPIRFLQHLSESYQGEEELTVLTCELLGYTLSGNRSAQVVPLLQGVPRSGKGVILDVLIELLGGQERVSTPKDPAQLGSRFGLGDAATKAAIVIGDMPATPPAKIASSFLDGMNLIKAISGNSPIQIERKNRDPANVLLPVVVWLANNWKVGWVKGAEDVTAWAERLIVLPFDQTVPPNERISDLSHRIIDTDTIASIANHCMVAYITAFQRGDGKRVDWTRSQRSSAVLSEIVAGGAGAVTEFVSARISFLPGVWTPRKAISEAYGVFVNREATRRDQQLIYTTLRNRINVRDGKRNGVPGFHGVSLDAVEEAAAPEMFDQNGTGATPAPAPPPAALEPPPDPTLERESEPVFSADEPPQWLTDPDDPGHGDP